MRRGRRGTGAEGRHAWRALAGALLLLAAAAPLRAATALLADGRRLEGVELRPGPSPDALVLEPQQGGEPVSLPAAELLAVDFQPRRPALVPASVRFANGDQVVGTVSFPTPRQVKVAAGWGVVTAPLAWCSAIRLVEKVPLPEAARQDTLLLAGDRLEGELLGVSDGKVRLEVSGRPVPVNLARVQALALAPRTRAPAPEGLAVVLDLGGGERLTGRWLRLSPDSLAIRTEWGEPVEVPLASLTRLEVKNGNLVYLSDLRPGEVRGVPFLGSAAGSGPHLTADRAVSGRPLRLRGREYARGLGMRSRSEATYSLNAGFAHFVATLGIDDAVGEYGSVIFRVWGDEKLLFESPVMRGGHLPLELNLDVKRVILLRLEVDYADAGDAADHANWAEARLRRE
jgi:hypothetical protein